MFWSEVDVDINSSVTHCYCVIEVMAVVCPIFSKGRVVLRRLKLSGCQPSWSMRLWMPAAVRSRSNGDGRLRCNAPCCAGNGARQALASYQARQASARLLMEPVIQLHKAHKAREAMARIKYASVVFSSNPAFSCASWSLFSKTGIPGRNWARLKEFAVRNELLSLSGHGALHAGHAMELPREFGHLQVILVFESGVKEMPAWVCQAQSISREMKAAGDPALWKQALAGRRSHAPMIELSFIKV